MDNRGQVVYQYKHPYRDGSTHVVLEPLDFIARLAALVPRRQLNLTRFHGIFAPNFKHWSRIVPHRTRDKIDAVQPAPPMSWMQRLKRVFAIDIETCPECGGKLRVIACIEVPPLIRRILGHVQRRETLIGSFPRAAGFTTGTESHLNRMGGESRGVFGRWPQFVVSGFLIDPQKAGSVAFRAISGRSEDDLPLLTWQMILGRIK